VQVFIGCLSVSDVKLHRLTYPNPVGNGQGSTFLVQGHYVADQEISPLEFALIFVDDPADMEALLDKVPFLGIDFSPQFLKAGKWRFAAQFGYHIVHAASDNHGVTNGTTSLGDYTTNLNRTI
jgi:hypothetical protein